MTPVTFQNNPVALLYNKINIQHLTHEQDEGGDS